MRNGSLRPISSVESPSQAPAPASVLVRVGRPVVQEELDLRVPLLYTGESPTGFCERIVELGEAQQDWAPGSVNAENLVLSVHTDGHEPLEDSQVDNVESVFISRHRRAQANQTSPASPRVPVYHITLTNRAAGLAGAEGDGAPPEPEVEPGRACPVELDEDADAAHDNEESMSSDGMEGSDPESPSVPADAAPMPWEINPRRIRDLVPAPIAEPSTSGHPQPKMLYAEWRALGIRAYGDWETALRRLAPTVRRRLASGVRMPRTTMVASSSPFILKTMRGIREGLGGPIATRRARRCCAHGQRLRHGARTPDREGKLRPRWIDLQGDRSFC